MLYVFTISNCVYANEQTRIEAMQALRTELYKKLPYGLQRVDLQQLVAETLLGNNLNTTLQGRRIFGGICTL